MSRLLGSSTNITGVELGDTVQRRGSQRPVVVMVVVLVVVAVCSIALRSSDGDPAVVGQRPTTTYTMFPSEPGEAFSLGSLNIRDPGGDVEILAVQPLVSANVEYLGAVAIWPSEASYHAGGPGFPLAEQPRHHPITAVVPAEEFEIVPEGSTRAPDLTITAGFRIREGLRGAVNGVTVIYRVGGDVREEHYRQAIIACVRPMKDCAPGRDLEDTILRNLGLLAE